MCKCTVSYNSYHLEELVTVHNSKQKGQTRDARVNLKNLDIYPI